MRIPSAAVLLALLLSLVSALSAAAPETPANLGPRRTVILIIRHAEKTGDQADRGLSKEGAQRAQRYVAYFRGYTLDGKPLKVDQAIATAASKHSDRPVETLRPTAQALNLPLEHHIADEDYLALAKQFQQGKYNGKNTLVCWHHGKIPELLDALGVTSPTYFPDHRWNEKAFCWLFQLVFDDQGHLTVTAKNVGLMKGDEAFGTPGRG